MTNLTQRSNLRGVVAVAGEYLLIAGALLLISQTNAWWQTVALLVFIGTRQYALAETLTHEAVHGNLCESRHLNDWLGILTTWPFFYILSGYRRHHLEHHQVDLSDPENNIFEQYEFWGLPDKSRPLSRVRAFWLFVLRPLSGVMAIYQIRTILSNVYWDRDLIENYLMLGCWLVFIMWMWQLSLLDTLFLCWIVPQLFVVGTLDFWSETSDHYRVSGASTRTDRSFVWNTLIAHNIGYHALHHQYPAIPWFRLPEAYRRHRSDLEEQTSSGGIESFQQVLGAGTNA